MGIREFIGISLCALGLCAVALGCRAPPSDQCRSYVACQEAYDEATGNAPVELGQYLADGACWDDASNAARCTDDCERGLTLLGAAADDEGLELPACTSG